MCMLSVVYDQFTPSTPYQWAPVTTGGVVTPAGVHLTLAELQEFLDAFHNAVEAAKVFDRLTGQHDCADPAKAALEARVAALEQKLKERTDGTDTDSA